MVYMFSKCINTLNNKPKLRHSTKEEAKKHLAEQQALSVHQYQIYRCRRCGYWHVGRRPQSNADRLLRPYYLKKSHDLYVEKVLVGQLIGILRGRKDVVIAPFDEQRHIRLYNQSQAHSPYISKNKE